MFDTKPDEFWFAGITTCPYACAGALWPAHTSLHLLGAPHDAGVYVLYDGISWN